MKKLNCALEYGGANSANELFPFSLPIPTNAEFLNNVLRNSDTK